MVLDATLPMNIRLGDNIGYFFSQIQNKDKVFIEAIIKEFDKLLTLIIKKKINISDKPESDYKLSLRIKADLAHKNGLLGTDLKRMIEIFDLLNQEYVLDNEINFESEKNKKLISEFLQLCDNDLFKLLSSNNELLVEGNFYESMSYYYAVISAVITESLVE